MDTVEYLKALESDLDLAVSLETIISFLIEKEIVSSYEEFNKRYNKIKNGPNFESAYSNIKKTITRCDMSSYDEIKKFETFLNNLKEE